MSPGSLLDVDTRAAARAEEPPAPGEIGVCHIASGDRWAGAEAQVAMLLRALRRRGEFALSAILLNEGRLAQEARQCGVDVRVIPEDENGFLATLRDATRYLRGKNIRIVHSHRYKENLLAALLAWRCEIPVVVRSQHGLPEPFAGLRHYKQASLQLLDRWVAQRATDCVISVSSELRNHLRRFIDDRKIVTIHNGVEQERVQSKLSVREAKERLGIPGNSPAVGTAGRLEPIKRIDIFLAAAEHIGAQLANAVFLISGTGSDEARLRNLAAHSGVAERILFLGHREDSYDVLRAMDVFVLCSDHEGLPTVLLEVLALSVPVVARPVGGIPEVIQSGVNGVLVNSADAVALAGACLALIGSEDQRKHLTRAGVVTVASSFSAECKAEEVASLYLRLRRGR